MLSAAVPVGPARRAVRAAALLLLLPLATACAASAERVRFCAFNIEDLRAAELEGGEAERGRRIAEIMQRIRPDVLLVNEIEVPPDEPDRAARRLAAHLARSAGAGLAGIDYDVFVAPSNTGVHSGLDLDRDGVVNDRTGTRVHGGDSLGYGIFPGQYAMALFVRRELTIERDRVRTFRTLLWRDVPGALLPSGDGERVPADESWYTPEMLAVLPLSSKSHWDVPVRTAGGAIVHVLASHPTPPGFDGPEDRNGRRNHDEIRFWLDYTGDDGDWIVDDAGERGPLPAGAAWVVMGDLNADPARGNARTEAIETLLERSGERPAPTSPSDPAAADRTARFGLRVDYVLPSPGLRIAASAVYRSPADAPGAAETAGATEDAADVPSDHFPVWVDVFVPVGGDGR